MAKAPEGSKAGDYIKGLGIVGPGGEIIPEITTVDVAVPDSLTKAIKEDKGSLTQGCDVQDGKKKGKKVQTSEAANKVINAAGAVQAEVAEVTDTLLAIIQELRAVTDCDVLQTRLRRVIKTVTDRIDGVIDEIEKQSGLGAILKLPKTPWGVIKWVKKLILGTILPQVKALIQLAKEIIKLIKTLEELIKLIKELDNKLKACAVEFAKEAIDDVVGAIEKEINEAIDQALGPVFCKIQKLQSQIDGALGVSTTQIDFSSTSNFINSAGDAIAAKEEAAAKAIEEPIDEIPGVNATLTDNAGNVFEFKEGTLTKVTPPPTPPPPAGP